ncbi:phage holin family protein [Streptococcus suis]|uniref:phage holin family protein n=1 Tax=Streptococcus suis TaxID=1307 RepID=UPI00209C40AC|nr:phage holin family protein [Streptococcus suis]MCO8221054.1 phage holin family protein [Streptococcus suis]HEM3512573.1 phage holin family protein [Streptococcus suis]
MKFIMTVNQLLFSTIGGLIGQVFGKVDGFVFALVVFVCIDYMTGLMAAVVEKKLSSRIGFKGIFKKIVLFFLVAVGHIIDTRLIQTGTSIRTAIIFFYLSNEGLSILENTVRIGLPIPKQLKIILKQFKEDCDK